MSCNSIVSDYPLSIFRGTSKTLKLQVLDAQGVAQDITGARILFTVKSAVTDAAPVFQKDSTDVLQIALTYPREGKAEIYLHPADTLSLSRKSYVYDVFVILASGRRGEVIPPSLFEIQETVTRVPLCLGSVQVRSVRSPSETQTGARRSSLTRCRKAIASKTLETRTRCWHGHSRQGAFSGRSVGVSVN